MRKLIFVSKCADALVHYFPETTAITTIDSMSDSKLKPYKDVDAVPDEVVKDCITVIFQRINLLQGHEDARRFIDELAKNGVT